MPGRKGSNRGEIEGLKQINRSCFDEILSFATLTLLVRIARILCLVGLKANDQIALSNGNPFPRVLLSFFGPQRSSSLIIKQLQGRKLLFE